MRSKKAEAEERSDDQTKRQRRDEIYAIVQGVSDTTPLERSKKAMGWIDSRAEKDKTLDAKMQ